MAIVYIYNSASDKDRSSLESFDFEFTMDVTDSGANPIKQAYEYLKTQDDINGVDYTTGTTDV